MGDCLGCKCKDCARGNRQRAITQHPTSLSPWHSNATLSRRRLLAWLAPPRQPLCWPRRPSEPTPDLAELRGTTPSGKVLDLASLRGQVVLVFYWSTDCAVCRNKMPELRANVAGWQGQNFSLLGVNMDAQQSAFLNYEEVVTPLLPAAQIFPSAWGLAPGYTDNLGPVPPPAQRRV